MNSKTVELTGLYRLEYGLILVGAGDVLTIVPYISSLGSLISFIGLILVILGWWALGHSSLRNDQRYHTTAVVLIVTFVISFLILLFGIIGMATNLAASATQTSEATLVVDAAVGGLELAAVAFVFLLLAQLYAAVSLRKLASDVSEPNLRKAGNLMILSQIVNVCAVSAVLVSVATGAFQNIIESAIASGSSSTITLDNFMFSSPYVYGILILIGYAVLLISTYFGAKGAKDAAMHIEMHPVSLQTSTPTSRSDYRMELYHRIRPCPYCRQEIRLSDNGPKPAYCPYCGKNLPPVFWD
jgi:hypothetical protein